MLLKRLITAGILIGAVVLLTLYLPLGMFAWVCLGFFALVAWEWPLLAGYTQPVPRLLHVGLFILLTLLLGDLVPGIAMVVGAALWGGIGCLLLIPKARKGFSILPAWLKGMLGIVLLGIGCVALILVRQMGLFWFFLLMILVWGADSVAYFVGKYVGRRKLMPTVSPNKTWEGFAAALGFAVVIGVLLPQVMNRDFVIYPLAFMGISLVTIVASVCGDLFESLCKRQQGLKDSGNWLPGHGGLLDRVDGLVAAAPLFALCLLWRGGL